jgi:hypothetical protein
LIFGRVGASIAVALDLQQDAADVYAFVADHAAAFTPKGDHGPGDSGPVKMIYGGFEFEQEGWFALVFDRRPDAAHDGEWTAHLEGNMLDRPEWAAAWELNQSEPISIRGADGVDLDLPAETDFGPLIGRMLVEVLQRAEQDGLFANLPRGDELELGLEDFNGSLGWSSRSGYSGQPA